MIPPIAIDNEAHIAVDLLLMWILVAGPFAIIFCFIVWMRKL